MNKLDPRQYNPYALNTPSGNLFTSEFTDYFELYLLESLTGNFSVTGSLKLNGEHVYSPDTTNNISAENNCHLFNGVNNTITGTDNSIISSSNSTIQGQNNTIIGGISNDISGDYSTAIGSYINILHTGATVLKDNHFTIGEDLGDNTLAVYFQNGIFLQNKTYIDDQLWITGGDFFASGYNVTTTNNINVGGSGMFSGDIQVLGTPYHTGSKLQNLHDFRMNSGVMKQALALASGILQTGVDSALSKADGGEITGQASFLNDTFVASGKAIRAITHNNLLYLNVWSPELDNHASGIFKNGFNLQVNEDDNNVDYHTGDLYFQEKSFSVENHNNDLIFGVNSSGHSFIKESIKMNTTSKPTSWNSYGLSGQFMWDESYFYVCTGWVGGGNSGWSRVAIGNW